MSADEPAKDAKAGNGARGRVTIEIKTDLKTAVLDCISPEVAHKVERQLCSKFSDNEGFRSTHVHKSILSVATTDANLSARVIREAVQDRDGEGLRIQPIVQQAVACVRRLQEEK